MLNKLNNKKRAKCFSLFTIMIGMLFCAPSYSQVDVEKDKSELVNFEILEVSPTHSDCDSAASNQEQKKCFSDKINKLVRENFDLDLGKKLGLSGIVKIHSKFIINKEGNIEDLKVVAEHPKLKEEVRRVISLIPQLQPGKQKGEAVNVLYNLPIQFNIQG
ncbi:energy transducer TonB [Lacinutrix mariniflava]|uniref:energy transducer TonB n=1 Tax=Lacinutrix mariniflava TaxID=342955 RepID=UPI0006E4000E|nr:energy transducer TonB [Lacinutrix mariniflava]